MIFVIRGVSMFFGNNAAVKIIDVMHLSRNKKISFTTSMRSFSVLSCRKKGETVFSKDGIYYEANDKSISLIPQNLSYAQTTSSEDLIAIHFDIYGDIPSNIDVFYPANFDDYELLFKKILIEWEDRNIGYALKCNSTLNKILCMIEKETFRQNMNYDTSIASRAAAIIEKRFSDSNFSLCEISEKLKISDAYLRIIFKNKYNVTLKEYQTKLRLEHARLLLESQYFSIKDVARSCGFSNEKYFSALFKKHFGMSPKSYKYSE